MFPSLDSNFDICWPIVGSGLKHDFRSSMGGSRWPLDRANSWSGKHATLACWGNKEVHYKQEDWWKFPGIQHIKVAFLCALHYIIIIIITSSTAQGGGGSFKNRKPIGEVGCCESRMTERSHWWIERCLISLTLSLSFSAYLPTYLSIFYVSIQLSIYLSISLSLSFIIYLSIYPSIDLL